MSGRKHKLSLLEYSKIILSKISFDRKLFRKEYKKAFRGLGNSDRVTLKNWVRAAYVKVNP
jgi:hypothetical protein